jgi:hypothetical protein
MIFFLLLAFNISIMGPLNLVKYLMSRMFDGLLEIIVRSISYWPTS